MIRLFHPVAVLALFLSAASLTAQARDDKSRTNILILLADDLGSGDLGMEGGAARTVNIDRLSREGVQLKRFYGHPLCSPARAALLTGRNPGRFGIVDALGPRAQGLPAGLPTLPRTLRAAGYQTWLVGKWHLGVASPPLQSGFEHFYGFEGPEIDYYQHTNRRGDVDWSRNGQPLFEAGYSTFLLADEATRLIENRDATKPFYLQVAFNAPHFPLSAPDDYLVKYKSLPTDQALRAAVIDALDASVGHILETLDEQGLRSNTLVVFLSDNGADRTGRNAPFRGGKGSVYEGGIRVPCILRWPGKLMPGSISQQIVSGQDLYPTLAAAVETPLADSEGLDGTNVWPALRDGRDEDHRPFLIAGFDTALFDRNWKLIETADSRLSLFDIINDPRESKDLVAQNPDLVKQLQAKLKDLKQDFPAVGRRPRRGPGFGGRPDNGPEPRPR